MPIFGYVCEYCKSQFENIEFTEEDKPTECADCHSKDLRRTIDLPSEPQFKGKGFYATDYKNKKSEN